MALLVGLIQTGITLLRLGDLTRYISHAVIVGFTLGAAVLLVLDQAKNLLGLIGAGQADDHFLMRFWLTMTAGRTGSISRRLLSASGPSSVLCCCLRYASLRFRIRLPEFLLAVIVMALVVWALRSGTARGVAVIGNIPRRLPTFEVPQLDFRLASASWPAARWPSRCSGLLEAIAMAKAIAAQTGQKLDINQQCLSEGLANLTGSFFQCFPGSGSLTRSAINQQAGAVTQWSGVISAVRGGGDHAAVRPASAYTSRRRPWPAS